MRWLLQLARVPSRGTTGVLLLTTLASAAPAFAQQPNVVGGTVVESKSMRPLSGAQVVIQGQGRGVLTDVNGRFRITGVTGSDVTIEVVMIGYRARTQTARVGDTAVRIALDEAAVELNEIVVTGTAGGTAKRAIGNSIAQVKAADAVATAPIKNTMDLINGRAAGVVVMPGTGMVGSGSRIRIRGQSTLSLSGEPLIYVDGVRVNNEHGSGFSMQAFGSGVISRLNDFNPDDIESIEILKGPAAATLYGTEAARGVINIITKKGAPGGARYTFNIKQGANWFMDPEGRMPTNWWKAPDNSIHSINLIVSENERGTPVFRTGDLKSYGGSISGGSDVVRYYMAGDWDKEEGAERNNAMDRLSARANLHILPRENLDISTQVGWIKSHTTLSCEAGCGGAMWGAMFGHPGLTNLACRYNNNAFGCGFSRGFQSRAPEGYYNLFADWQDIDRFTGSVTGNWKPFPWFANKLTVGTDVTDEQNEEIGYYVTTDTLVFWAGPTGRLGGKYQSRRHQTFNTFDYSGTAGFDVTQKLNSQTSLGVQYYQRHIEYIYAQGQQFSAPGLETVLGTATNKIAEDDYLDNNTLGVFAQEQLGIGDRLFLTGAVRVDNNSAFGTDFDWVVYPKASVSWILHEEPFVRDRLPSFLNQFRLRSAYGHSGQQPISFSALRTFSPTTGPNNAPAVTPSTVGNASLGPERVAELEVGFDAGLFDDRLSIDFTYYTKKAKDAILLKSVAPSTGFSGSQYVNAGEISGSGLEAMVRGTVFNSRNIGLDLTLNMMTTKDEITDLGGEPFIASGRGRHQVGYEVGSWFLPRVVSATVVTNPNGSLSVQNAMCQGGPEQNNEPVPCFNAAGARVAPFVYQGRPTPSFEATLTGSLRVFNRLRVGAMLDRKTGHYKFDNNERARCAIFAACRINVAPQEFDQRKVAAMLLGTSIEGEFVKNADFTRLREVSLTYDVPETLIGRVGAKNLAINLAMRNIHTWTKYDGLDPENYFLSGTPGFLEQNNLPLLAQFVTSIQVSF
jgi:TonB-linked SusC/RagA family outer membrane protein